MDILKSRKFIYTVLALAAFLTLALTGTVVFSTTEVIGVIFGLLGIPVSGHVVTDVASIIRGLQDPDEPTPVEIDLADEEDEDIDTDVGPRPRSLGDDDEG